MKLRILALIEFLVIVALAVALVAQFISLKKTKAVVREPKAPGESTLRYTPPPPPKFSVIGIKKLAELKRTFTPRVTKITDHIYYASGYALGGVQMVITNEGLVIIDTTESKEAAKEILREFRKITDKPIRYIIYTHGHVDHICGSKVFMEKGTEVIATEDAVNFLRKDFGWLDEFQNRSRHNQFGDVAEAYARKIPIKAPFRLPTLTEGKDFVWPTITFEREYTFVLGGKRFELFHTIGETPDHLMLWLPDEKALFCGDLYYLSFPNLSSPMLEPRPVRGWYESLERMIAMEPEYLIPGHTSAIIGAGKVRQALTHHSRAIRYVYEQTIKCINEGKSVEEAVQTIKLPEELAQTKQLEEGYGRVDWSVRGIYQGEVGWYDGRGTKLNPLPPGYRARELVALAEGADKILARAIDLQKKGEHQLVCELCDVVLEANSDDKLAHIVKANSLEYLAYASGNLNMFGFYRSAASLERQAAGVKP
ncbi:MAG: alkyl/aryl-sulfatase [Desulfobacteraceae bacterium]|jgi:alkyl sulfatase BDS1-like metallo-beta-lactamase superfamily hydrolase